MIKLRTVIVSFLVVVVVLGLGLYGWVESTMAGTEAYAEYVEGESARDIAIFHVNDFAEEYRGGYIPTKEGDGLQNRLSHHFLFTDSSDIPSYFVEDGHVVPECGASRIELSFVQEVADDGSSTFFSYNGGEEDWRLSCED